MPPLSVDGLPGRRDPRAKPRDEGEAPARLLRRGNRSSVLRAAFVIWTRTWSGRQALERRGFVSTYHVSEQFGKCDRRIVFVERTNNLCADGESARRTPYGCSYGGQAWQ
jgi:hypothetical protein